MTCRTGCRLNPVPHPISLRQIQLNGVIFHAIIWGGDVLKESETLNYLAAGLCKYSTVAGTPVQYA